MFLCVWVHERRTAVLLFSSTTATIVVIPFFLVRGDLVEEAGEEVDAGDGHDEQARDLEDGGPEIDHRVVLRNPASRASIIIFCRLYLQYHCLTADG